MRLHCEPSLAEVPDLSAQRLQSLTRSVEQQKQKLEDDISAYISRKQDELRNYEQELVEQYRSMDRAPSTRDSDDDKVANHTHSADANSSPNSPAAPVQPTDPSTASTKLGPSETAKRTKHTRVHKREKELCGLVTPIFLPLLEAGADTSTKKRKEKRKQKEAKSEEVGNTLPGSEQGYALIDNEQRKENHRSRSKNRAEKMERGDEVAIAGDDAQKSESGRKSKRSAIKKSSLKHTNSRPRRKRVSLVIDDQIVLPADNITEPPLTSPSETTASTASSSTTTLDEMIDPRLVPRHDTPVHNEPVHHSLPLPTALPSTSPTKHTGHTLAESPPPLEYDPPQTSPQTAHIITSPYSSAAPIYADDTDLLDEEEAADVDPDNFDTYVGGIEGSGLDDVNQSGSYGYPSSLGASYLESYMKSRPLRVRMAAAEKAELEENEKKRLIQGDRDGDNDDVDMGVGRVDFADEGMEVIGSMEGF